MDFKTLINYITGSGFLFVLIAAGLFTFSLAYLVVRYIEKKEFEQYATHILSIGFLLVCISFLVTRGPPVLTLKIIYYITYVSGIICTIVAPGLYVKKLFPKKLSTLLLASPSIAIPFLFYNCAGNSCGMEFITIHLYCLHPVFEYFGAIMFSVMAFGLMILLLVILKKENKPEKIVLILVLAALCAFLYYISPIAGAIPAAAYLYTAFKENGIETDVKKIIILYISAGITALILPVLGENYIYCVNSCTFDLLITLALALIILGTTSILKK